MEQSKKITAALISVYYKDGLEPIVRKLHKDNVTIYSTGGTQTFIESLGIPVVAVESMTNYPEIFGGRVKTLHPAIFGGILHRRNLEGDLQQAAQFNIPTMDLVAHMLEVAHQEPVNKMGVANLVTVFAPNLLRSREENLASMVTDMVVVARVVTLIIDTFAQWGEGLGSMGRAVPKDPTLRPAGGATLALGIPGASAPTTEQGARSRTVFIPPPAKPNFDHFPGIVRTPKNEESYYKIRGEKKKKIK